MSFLFLAWGFVQRGFGAVLTFCSKPPGSWIAAALAALLGLWWYGHHQYAAGVSACEIKHAEAEANEIARLGQVYVDADKRSNVRTDVSEKKNTDNQKRVANVKTEAAAMPGASDVCIPADVADQLREIN